jgi:hypothetical protein
VEYRLCRTHCFWSWFQIFYKSCLICPLSNFIRYHVCDLQLESPMNSALCRCRVSLDGMLGQSVDMGLRSKPLKFWAPVSVDVVYRQPECSPRRCMPCGHIENLKHHRMRVKLKVKAVQLPGL